jgi:hypothetical protein
MNPCSGIASDLYLSANRNTRHHLLRAFLSTFFGFDVASITMHTDRVRAMLLSASTFERNAPEMRPDLGSASERPIRRPLQEIYKSRPGFDPVGTLTTSF